MARTNHALQILKGLKTNKHYLSKIKASLSNINRDVVVKCKVEHIIKFINQQIHENNCLDEEKKGKKLGYKFFNVIINAITDKSFLQESLSRIQESLSENDYISSSVSDIIDFTIKKSTTSKKSTTIKKSTSIDLRRNARIYGESEGCRRGGPSQMRVDEELYASILKCSKDNPHKWTSFSNDAEGTPLMDYYPDDPKNASLNKEVWMAIVISNLVTYMKKLQGSVDLPCVQGMLRVMGGMTRNEKERYCNTFLTNLLKTKTTVKEDTYEDWRQAVEALENAFGCPLSNFRNSLQLWSFD